MDLKDKFAINFYIWKEETLFARRILAQVPAVNDLIVFKGQRYRVIRIEWCLDEDATNYEFQALVNVEIEKIKPTQNVLSGIGE